MEGKSDGLQSVHRLPLYYSYFNVGTKYHVVIYEQVRQYNVGNFYIANIVCYIVKSKLLKQQVIFFLE